MIQTLLRSLTSWFRPQEPVHDIAPEADIAQARETLSRRFGIGQGRLVVVDDPFVVPAMQVPVINLTPGPKSFHVERAAPQGVDRAAAYARRNFSSWPTEIQKAAMSLYLEGGHTHTEVAALYGVHASSICRWLQKFGTDPQRWTLQ